MILFFFVISVSREIFFLLLPRVLGYIMHSVTRLLDGIDMLNIFFVFALSIVHTNK